MAGGDGDDDDWIDWSNYTRVDCRLCTGLYVQSNMTSSYLSGGGGAADCGGEEVVVAPVDRRWRTIVQGTKMNCVLGIKAANSAKHLHWGLINIWQLWTDTLSVILCSGP